MKCVRGTDFIDTCIAAIGRTVLQLSLGTEKNKLRWALCQEPDTSIQLSMSTRSTDTGFQPANPLEITHPL